MKYCITVLTTQPKLDFESKSWNITSKFKSKSWNSTSKFKLKPWNVASKFESKSWNCTSKFKSKLWRPNSDFCFSQRFALTCQFFFLFLAEMGSLTFSDHSGGGKTQTDWRTTNDGNNKKKERKEKNKLCTTSAQQVLFYMHSADQCTQSQVSSLLPPPATDTQTL